MEFGEINHFLTGVVVPVFSLRTEDSCGIGEFHDLLKLGNWCKKTGIDLIQILPVNDTGAHTSPYSAQSAFALNPVYIRLQAIKGMDKFNDEIENVKSELEKEDRVDYDKISDFKRSILSKYYLLYKDEIKKDKEFLSWITKNLWLKNYTVYCALKDTNNHLSWKDWEHMRDPMPSKIDKYWKEKKDEVLFYSWIQYQLENQLRSVSLKLQEQGLKLKGDIPILINEDSADIWAERHYFDLTVTVGAPPDMFAKKGQNWGFPYYNWFEHEKDDYRWWRDRLKQASKFYHTYRIDHVLGFFRIWQFPDTEEVSILGHFNPSVPIEKSELEDAGFNDDKIKTFISPQFMKSQLMEFFGEDAERLINKYFQSFQRENDVLVFSKNISGEKSIKSLKEDENIRNKLLNLHWDRVLIPLDDNNENFLPAWFFYKTSTFNSLPEDERMRLKEIIDKNWASQDDLWRENGLKMLRMMCDTTDMLVCAEDLGAVPACVPETLNELGILGIKIERWHRDYQKESEPYYDPKDYPRLSVCSPSLHDSSTLRGWWEEKDWDRRQYFSLLNMHEECPDHLTTEVCERIIKRNLGANSMLSVFLLQDILSLYYTLRTEHSDEERINVPGTHSPKNWSYRMKMTIEDLMKYDEYNNYLRGLIDERRNRSFR